MFFMNGWNFKAQTFKYPDQDDKKHRFDYKIGSTTVTILNNTFLFLSYSIPN